jgi:hypothetical protein
MMFLEKAILYKGWLPLVYYNRITILLRSFSYVFCLFLRMIWAFFCLHVVRKEVIHFNFRVDSGKREVEELLEDLDPCSQKNYLEYEQILLSSIRDNLSAKRYIDNIEKKKA